MRVSNQEEAMEELTQQLIAHLKHVRALLQTVMQPEDFEQLPSDMLKHILLSVKNSLSQAMGVQAKLLTIVEQNSYDRVADKSSPDTIH